MTDINIFSEKWHRQATEMKAKLGGIRIGPFKALETSTVEHEPEDEETLQKKEEALRAKLAADYASH